MTLFLIVVIGLPALLLVGRVGTWFCLRRGWMRNPRPGYININRRR